MFEFDVGIICPDDITATKERIEQYKDYYKIKYDICKSKNPSVIAEIGVRAGYSAWSFLQACPDAKFFGFDANNGKHGGQGGESGVYFRWAENLLKEYNIELIEVDTQKIKDLPIDTEIDFFHVDGDHSVMGVVHDLNLAFSSIRKGGHILIDDMTFLDTVKEGGNIWLEANKDKIKYEFIESLRGECLVEKK